MTTHVALVRHHRTGVIEPASQNGVVICGTPTELRAQFGGMYGRLVKVEPKRLHVRDRLTMSFSSWLAS